MNFSAYSIRNPIPAVLLFVLLSLAGLLAFKNAAVQDFPDIELPFVSVDATLAGAAPAQLETEVAKKIENAVAPLQGVKNIFTKVLDGVVNVTVEFVLEKNSSEAVTEVRDAVSRIRAELPPEMVEPAVTKASTAGKPVLTYALSSKQFDTEALSWFVDNNVNKRLLSIPGVGSIKRMGGRSREIRIELDEAKMAALNVSAADVSRRLKAVQVEAPGGRGDVGGVEQAVRTIATVKTAGELSLISIPLADGRQIRLDQVAKISDTTAELRSQAYLNSDEVVAFEVLRTRGASELDVASGVEAAIAELKVANPAIGFVQAINNAKVVQENFDGSMHLLYEGALLAVIVVWFFLRDWRATLVSAAALPLSVIPTFLGLSYFGYSLNTVTLLSLALVVGILVDDAIVEIENIARHLRMGKPPIQAAMEAADEIGLAVIATTFALVAVFLPTAFLSGIPGKFFKQFGWTAVLAIVASLVVARLLTPMMAAYLLKPKKHTEEKKSKVMAWYLRAVTWCIKHRWITVFLAAAFFAGSIGIIGFLPKGFVPPSDRAQTLVSIELPPGSTLDQTRAATEKVRAELAKMPDVKSVFSSVGGGLTGDIFAQGAAAESRKSALTVTLTHRTDRKRNQQEVETEIRQRLSDQPGVRLQVGSQDTGVKLQLVLRSEDAVALDAATRDLERELRTLKGIGNVSSSASLVRPEILVKPDFARAADLGVTAQSMADVVRIATSGDYTLALSKLNVSERQVPIRVQLPNAVRADIASLERLTVPGKNGPVMLGNVAAITVQSGPAQIDRLNRSRNVTVDVELAERTLGEVNDEALALPALRNLPPSVRLAELGDAQEMKALNESFSVAMGIGVLCIYMVLVLLFKDFLQPITILAALPLSFGGAFILLWITGKSFSMPSLIGILMLMGVVTKNSILLIEYAIVARRNGMGRLEALVDACFKRSRPIVMTTIAMGAGMLPIALGWGVDPSFRSPMAVAVIGGLITSTLLSLLVVPPVYTIIDDVEVFFGRLFKRKAKTKAAVVINPV
jgi:multidrug efflux pump subunit AcrB